MLSGTETRTLGLNMSILKRLLRHVGKRAERMFVSMAAGHPTHRKHCSCVSDKHGEHTTHKDRLFTTNIQQQV